MMKELKAGLRAGAAGAALCLATGSALAQSNSDVTMYGVMDIFATQIKPQGASTVERLDSSGLMASRWGLRGQEDLGSGLKTNFDLEFGLNVNDGSAADANRTANRQAWVGLSGDWGELRLGRQNTPQFFMNGKFDAFNGGTQASGWNNFSGTAPRVDNAISYFAPALGAVKAQVMVARGAMGGAPVAAETRANQNWHAAIEYEVPTVYAGLNYEQVDSQSTPTNTAKRTGLAASYAFATDWRVYGAYGKEKRTDDSLDLNIYALSVGWQLAPQQNLAVGYARVNDKLSGTGHGDADQGSILYRYKFTKRTTVYTGYSHLQQHGQRSSFTLAGAAVVESGARPTSVAGGSITGLQLGLTHLF